MTALIKKLLHSWLFLDPSEPHYTTQISKFKFSKNLSTMLNNVFNIFPCVQILAQEAEQAAGKQVQTCGVPRSASAVGERGGLTEGDRWQVETIPSTSVPWCLTRKLYQRSKRSDLEIFIWKKVNQIYNSIWKNIKSIFSTTKKKRKKKRE